MIWIPRILLSMPGQEPDISHGSKAIPVMNWSNRLYWDLKFGGMGLGVKSTA